MDGYINTKEVLKEFLEIERKLYKRSNTRIPLVCLGESDYLWRHAALLRWSEYYTNTGRRIRGAICRFLLNRFQCRHHMRVPLNVFDSGLKIMHLGPIQINNKTRGGKNISIHVNAGMLASGLEDDAPVLEDGIVVGVGAMIVGNVHLAKNIAIGTNAVVTRSFDEENICIAGVPAKKISDNGRLTWKNAMVKRVVRADNTEGLGDGSNEIY